MPTRNSAFWSVFSVAYDLIWDSPPTKALADVIEGCESESGLVVDLGCGTGLISRELLLCSRSVIGMDNSAQMLARASRLGRVSTALLADAASPGLAAASAATVVLSNVIQFHPTVDRLLSSALQLASLTASIVVTWPTATASGQMLAQADLRTGRTWWRTALAFQLRAIVAAIARVMDGSARDPAWISDAVQGWTLTNSLTVLRREEVFGCQHVVMLRRAIALVRVS